MKISFDSKHPICIAHATQFWNTPPVNAFHLPAPHISPVRAGTFVGDTREGGSVNCFLMTVCPHGSGTHSECVGHIVDDRVSVMECHNGRLLSAHLVRVAPVRMEATTDQYAGQSDDSDWVIERSSLDRLTFDAVELDALILIVELPDGPCAEGHFSGQNAPYLTQEAMEWVDALLPDDGHLLTNLPSIDREQCGGHTPNHRKLWGLVGEERKAKLAQKGRRVLTELVKAAACPPDGAYVLDIQIAPFDTDAAPSRPILYVRT